MLEVWGLIPAQARKIWYPDTLLVICRDDMNNVRHPLVRDVQCMDSHALCMLKNPTSVTCRLILQKTPECTMYTCLECLCGRMTVHRKRKKRICEFHSVTNENDKNNTPISFYQILTTADYYMQTSTHFSL